MTADTIITDVPSDVNSLDLKPILAQTWRLIKSLSNRRGFCFSGNDFLCENLGGIHQTTLYRRMARMLESGFLEITITRDFRRRLRAVEPDKRKKNARKTHTPQPIDSIRKKSNRPPTPGPSPEPEADPVCGAAVVVVSHAKALERRAFCLDAYPAERVAAVRRHIARTPGIVRPEGFLRAALLENYNLTEPARLDTCPFPVVAASGVTEKREVTEFGLSAGERIRAQIAERDRLAAKQKRQAGYSTA